MHANQTISYPEACAFVGAALDAARAAHGDAAAVACAVVGASGELIAFGAQDGTGVLPRRLASRKAYSAVLFKRDTSAVRDAVDAGAIPLSRLGDDELLPIPGGVPVVVDGRIVGGVGVSGLAPDQDAEIARGVVAGGR
ncbi:MAG: heme-binding protein [Protaetiibacter sp.]